MTDEDDAWCSGLLTHHVFRYCFYDLLTCILTAEALYSEGNASVGVGGSKWK